MPDRLSLETLGTKNPGIRDRAPHGVGPSPFAKATDDKTGDKQILPPSLTPIGQLPPSHKATGDKMADKQERLAAVAVGTCPEHVEG